jgi:hypothetical protein
VFIRGRSSECQPASVRPDLASLHQDRPRRASPAGHRRSEAGSRTPRGGALERCAAGHVDADAFRIYDRGGRQGASVQRALVDRGP